METATFCKIMNRIRRTAAKLNHSDDEIAIRFSLINGETVIAMIFDYELLDDYIEVWTQNENFCYIPIKNIVAINI